MLHIDIQESRLRSVFFTVPVFYFCQSFRLFFFGVCLFFYVRDYVDRGKQSLETICLLLAYKIKYPENFFVLRGNHECASINRIYGFYDECEFYQLLEVLEVKPVTPVV